MQQFRLGDRGEEPLHECTSVRTGDWIIFRCSQCADYERRINWRTGEMVVRDNRIDIMHTGLHLANEYREAFTNLN